MPQTAFRRSGGNLAALAALQASLAQVSTIVPLTGPPQTGDGDSGDMGLDYADVLLYGPKSGTTWPAAPIPQVKVPVSRATAKTLALTDMNSFIRVTTTVTITIPTNATVPFPVGARLWIQNAGAAVSVTVGGSGVTTRSVSGTHVLTTQWSTYELTKVDVDEWNLQLLS